MKNAEYKGEIYNIETIYIYDEYISLYKGNLLETEPIKVALSEVKILPIQRVSVSVCDCGNFSVEAYYPCCSLSCWYEKYE